MTLPSYASLGTVHRGKPCQEYPGTWGVYISDSLQHLAARHWGALPAFHRDEGWIPEFLSFEDALVGAESFLESLENWKVEYDPRDISICWKCSDNDPRIGQVWFTPFYEEGHFNPFGQFVST